MVQGRQCPVEVDRQQKGLGQIGYFSVPLDDLILERQQYPGVDLERQVQIERTAARFFRVQFHLPGLAE